MAAAETTILYRSEEFTFRNENGIVTHTIDTLTEDVALFYFRESQFYYDNNVNEIVLRETHGASMVVANAAGIASGVYYTSASPASGLFVIRMLERKPDASTRVLAIYYILHGTIYRSPDIYSVGYATFLNSLFHIHNSFKALLGDIEYDVTDNSYRQKPRPSKDSEKKPTKDNQTDLVLKRKAADPAVKFLIDTFAAGLFRASIPSSNAESSDNNNNSNSNNSKRRLDDEAEEETPREAPKEVSEVNNANADSNTNANANAAKKARKKAKIK